MEKQCQQCGGKVFGRVDKLFCSDQCRTSFHNKRYAVTNKIVNTVNKVLWTNRKIMKNMNPSGKAKVSKENLLAAGFNFKYFTNEFVTSKGMAYRFCYDYGYAQLDEETYVLVIKQDYID